MQETQETGLIPGWGRSPGRGHGSTLQYPWLENPMDRGTWRATVYRVAKSQTQLKWLRRQRKRHLENSSIFWETGLGCLKSARGWTANGEHPHPGWSWWTRGMHLCAQCLGESMLARPSHKHSLAERELNHKPGQSRLQLRTFTKESGSIQFPKRGKSIYQSWNFCK